MPEVLKAFTAAGLQPSSELTERLVALLSSGTPVLWSNSSPITQSYASYYNSSQSFLLAPEMVVAATTGSQVAVGYCLLLVTCVSRCSSELTRLRLQYAKAFRLVWLCVIPFCIIPASALSIIKPVNTEMPTSQHSAACDVEKSPVDTVSHVMVRPRIL